MTADNLAAFQPIRLSDKTVSSHMPAKLQLCNYHNSKPLCVLCARATIDSGWWVEVKDSVSKHPRVILQDVQTPHEGTKKVMKTICRINPIINYRILNWKEVCGHPSCKIFDFGMQSFIEPSRTLEKRLDYLLIAAAVEEQLQLSAAQKPDTTHQYKKSINDSQLSGLARADVFVRRFSSVQEDFLQSAAKFSFGYESWSWNSEAHGAILAKPPYSRSGLSNALDTCLINIHGSQTQAQRENTQKHL